MLNIWKKPQDDLDPEKVLDQELDDILDDMLLQLTVYMILFYE